MKALNVLLISALTGLAMAAAGAAEAAQVTKPGQVGGYRGGSGNWSGHGGYSGRHYGHSGYRHHHGGRYWYGYPGYSFFWAAPILGWGAYSYGYPYYGWGAYYGYPRYGYSYGYSEGHESGYSRASNEVPLPPTTEVPASMEGAPTERPLYLNYCETSKAYFPKVTTCASGWQMRRPQYN